MALIDKVKVVCDRLSGSGWRDLMLKHGIDISHPDATQLAAALDSSVSVDREIPGFEDFISDQAKGIEPGRPAESLLYHAFASPHVTRVPDTDTPLGANSRIIEEFPTEEEIEVIENYVYAKASHSLDSVFEIASERLGISRDEVELSVAVFSSEYRPAPETPHQRFADLCLARTGVSRVGTASAQYDGRLRGYVPFSEGDHVNSIRVLPCKFSTWLAVRSKGMEDRFGPSRIQSSDLRRDFWVPVHKLFDGTECLDGLDLEIELTTRHQNRKIEKLHEGLEAAGIPSGFDESDRQNSPFIIEHGIAEWLPRMSGGSKVLSPVAQPLSKRETFQNNHLSFETPRMGAGSSFSDAFSPTLSLNVPTPPIRPMPEYAHVRFDVRNNSANYFGNDANAESRATAGGYRALNISDATGDGWVKASVPAIADLNSIPAYSLVAAPDFFPGVDQREVQQWWEDAPSDLSVLPQWMRPLVQSNWDFWRAGPNPLSDIRFAPNVKLDDSDFDKGDKTVTAVVTTLQEIDLSNDKKITAKTQRHAVLPDAAAGVFAPGWDTSADTIPGTNEPHFATYGLGSPFPEDAKLCAALSTFWPAAAPDTTRTFFAVDFDRGTVCPLTDTENGSAEGSVPWDGIRGPRVVQQDGQRAIVRYPQYDMADYTQNALEGSFSIAETAKITFGEYTNRILATLRMYRVLSQIGDKDSLHVLSFQQVVSSDPILLDAQNETSTMLSGPIYRFDVFDDEVANSIGAPNAQEEDFEVTVIFTLLIGQSNFLLAMGRIGDGSVRRGAWQVIDA